MRSIRFVAFAVALSIVAATSAHADGGAGPVPLPVGEAGLSVTIQTEPVFKEGVPFAVSGNVYAVFALPVVVELARGVQHMQVDVLVDGARRATVTTNAEGYYNADLFLTSELTSHTIQTAIFRGTPAEVRSRTRTVDVDEVFIAMRVDPSTASVGQGAAYQLLAFAEDDDGRVRDVTSTATWTSSAPTIASVDNGLVTGVAPGTADITASFRGQSAVSVVTVLDDGR